MEHSHPDRAKTVYFVRHGETRQNRAHVHQYPEDTLSERGVRQAHRTAGALRGKGIEIVLASDLTRAAETGSIIAQELNVPIEYSALLHEVRRPTFLWGISHRSFASLYFFTRYFLTGVVANIRLKNEETMREFEERVGRALDLLAARPEKVLAVATHRGVLSILGVTMRSKGHASGLALLFALLHMHAVDNGEITTAVYENGTWRIVASNENRHLHDA